MPANLRGALLGLPLLLLVGCGSSIDVASTQAPNAGDPKPTAGTVTADYDPSTGNIPLPNVLVTGTVTAPLIPTPGVPLTPDKALVWLNQREVAGTNAVAGINAPIYLSFSAAVDPASLAGNLKVFQALPDNPANPSSTENNALGFIDVSSQFTFQVLVSGKEVYAMPKVPLRPGGRYVCVATTGIKDSTGLSINPSVAFKVLEYVKAGGTSYANDTTNLTDFSDASNPALLLGATAAAGLEQLDANVTVSGQVAFSGLRKTMWDLISASAATGISSRSQIAVVSRFIVNGSGYTKPDPVGHPANLVPLETLLWGWANNANLSATPLVADFSNAGSRQWSNGVTNFQIIGSASIPSGTGSIGNIFGAIPHSHVGTVSWGAFQSADLQMDPGTVLANLAVAGGNEDGTATGFASGTPYNPGTSAPPGGTGTLMAFRDGTGVMHGFYHTSRKVPFVLITPLAAPGTTFKTAIFMHGISRSKEDVLAMADSACAAGYAVISIDQAVHGYPAGAGSLTAPTVPAMGNNRPQPEWASNFFMLPSSLTARVNLYDSAFNLWRLERVLNQPSIDPTSLAAQFNTNTGGAWSLNTGPTTHAFISQSLGSIVGTLFLAGNSSQTGGSNMKGFLSVPGARLAFVLHDSPSFKTAVDGGLAAAGIATDSPTYNKFFVLAQGVADSADPASMMLPLPGAPVSRLAGRITAQEAVGDLVIPNSNGDYWGNALGGRTPQLGADISAGFTQILHGGQTTVAHPFMFGTSFVAPFKAPVAAAVAGDTSPTQGYFQYGTTTTAANHGLLLDGSANTLPAQRQMALWLATGLVVDGAASNGFPLAGSVALPIRIYGPEDLQIHYPQQP